MNGFDWALEKCLIQSVVSRLDEVKSTLNSRQSTAESKLRADMINKSLLGVLAKLNLVESHLDPKLMNVAFAYNQFDLALKLSLRNSQYTTLLVRKLLALNSNQIIDKNYLSLMSRTRLDWLDHDSKQKLVENLLSINSAFDWDTFDFISAILGKLILNNETSTKDNSTSVVFTDLDSFFDQLFKSHKHCDLNNVANMGHARTLPDLQIFHLIRQTLIRRSYKALRIGDMKQMLSEAYLMSSVSRLLNGFISQNALELINKELERLITSISQRNKHDEVELKQIIEVLLSCCECQPIKTQFIDKSLTSKLIDEIENQSEWTDTAVRLLWKLDREELLRLAGQIRNPLTVFSLIDSIVSEPVLSPNEKESLLGLIEFGLSASVKNPFILVRFGRAVGKACERLRGDEITLPRLTKLIDKTVSLLLAGGYSIECEERALELIVESMRLRRSQAKTIMGKLMSEFQQKPSLIRLRTLDLLIEFVLSNADSDLDVIFK